jgi:hypothetical protein
MMSPIESLAISSSSWLGVVASCSLYEHLADGGSRPPLSLVEENDVEVEKVVSAGG